MADLFGRPEGTVLGAPKFGGGGGGGGGPVYTLATLADRSEILPPPPPPPIPGGGGGGGAAGAGLGSAAIAAYARQANVSVDVMAGLLQKAQNGTLAAQDMMSVVGVPPVNLPTQLGGYSNLENTGSALQARRQGGTAAQLLRPGVPTRLVRTPGVNGVPLSGLRPNATYEPTGLFTEGVMWAQGQAGASGDANQFASALFPGWKLTEHTYSPDQTDGPFIVSFTITYDSPVSSEEIPLLDVLSNCVLRSEWTLDESTHFHFIFPGTVVVTPGKIVKSSMIMYGIRIPIVKILPDTSSYDEWIGEKQVWSVNEYLICPGAEAVLLSSRKETIYVGITVKVTSSTLPIWLILRLQTAGTNAINEINTAVNAGTARYIEGEPSTWQLQVFPQ